MNVSRCEVCEALVDIEDLFCANCGREIPDGQASRSVQLDTGASNFECRGCGASMNYDATAQALKCPFCGSVDLAEQVGQSILAPERVVPPSFDRHHAEQRLRSWLGSSFWHPNDLRHAAELTDLKAVFVPFWIFTTDVSTHWTADSGHTPPGARGDWFPMSGTRHGRYTNLWVPAGSGVPPAEIAGIMPFHSDAAVPADRVNLRDVTVEQFALKRGYARPLLQKLVEQHELAAVAEEVPGPSRNLHVNVLLDGVDSHAALAPIYVMAYRYRDRLYRFVINGQTGKATGSAPTSLSKVALVGGGILVIIIVVLVLVAGH